MIGGQRAALTAAVAVGAVCLLLAYLSSTGRLPPALSVGIALAPLILGAVAIGWRTRLRWAVVLAMATVVVATAAYITELAQHVPTLWFVQHATGHALLAILFGRTLLPGEEPLATRIARAVLPSMPPEVVEYSRGVTVAWTIYFVAMTAISIALFLGASAAVWSTFATLISGPLVALMFVLEFALRRRLMPASHCASIVQTVMGFRALMRARSPNSMASRQLHG